MMRIGTAFSGKAAKGSGRLCAGTAKVDITPPVGIPMWGYEEGIRSQGIHDPLMARVIVLKNGHVSLAIVSFDLVYPWFARIIAEAKRKWKLDYVILSASHTHGGFHCHPDMWYSPLDDKAIAAIKAATTNVCSLMEAKVIAAIGEASTNLFPARIGAGMGPVESEYFGYNRRVVGTDGNVAMLWTNPARKPMGPTDPTVRVIRIDDDGGKTRALLVHYACHPVTLGSSNRLLSADFPGSMAAHIEQELGDQGIAMFLQGGGGDVHPYEAVTSGERAFQLIRESGISLGKAALRVAKQIGSPENTSPVPIKVQERVLAIPYREDHTKIVDAGVMAVVINNDIALAVISHEPFVQHQLDLVVKSPLTNTFLLGYSFFGRGTPLFTYLPTIQAAKEGGYGAGPGRHNHSILEVGAGERMVDEAVRSIAELVQSAK